MNKLILLLCSFFLLLNLTSIAQPSVDNAASPNYPKLNEPCPDFRLDDVRYFQKKEISLSDFKEKWLLLDFFTTGCVSCFKSFPKMNELKNEFDGSVQIMLVGLNDGKLPQVYEKYRQRLNLSLPVAYDKDRSVFNQFGVVGVPHIVLIDPDGIVRAIVNGISREVIQDFLDGRHPDLLKKPYEEEIEARNKLYNPKQTLLVNGNGGRETDYLFRSILTRWNGDIVGGSQDFVSNPVDCGEVKIYGRVQVIGFPLRHLYNMAYGDTVETMPRVAWRPTSYGKQWIRPILELSDSSDFEYFSSSKKNLYNYSLSVPESRASARFLQQVMQADLSNYFGYEVHVENRLMPYWRITATASAKKTLLNHKRIDTKKESLPRDGFRMLNRPVEDLVRTLSLCFPDQYPFIDATGITENISVEVDALQTDFDDMKRSLAEKNGLILERGEKEMRVIVIRNKR